MGSFLGGLGASFVSYAANDADFLLEDIDALNDFYDDNLGSLMPNNKENNAMSTELGVKKNSPSVEGTEKLNVPEISTPEIYADPATDIGDSRKINASSFGRESGKNLDTDIVSGTNATDASDFLYSNNNLNNTLRQDIINLEEINGSHVNNEVDTNLKQPVEPGKDVNTPENLSDLYPQVNNNKTLNIPVAPTKDVPGSTKTKNLHKDKVNGGKNKKSVDDKNSKLKLLGGLTAGVAGPFALIKYNKELKSSVWLDKFGGLIDKVKNKWTSVVTSEDNKNPDEIDTQKTGEKNPGEGLVVPVTTDALDTASTEEKSEDKKGSDVTAPIENIDQNQVSKEGEGSSAFGILVKLFGIFGAVLITICILKNKSETKKSEDEKKKEMVPQVQGQDHNLVGIKKSLERLVFLQRFIKKRHLNKTKTGENEKKDEKDSNTTDSEKQENELSSINQLRKELEEINKDNKTENGDKNSLKKDSNEEENIEKRKNSLNLSGMVNQKKNNIHRRSNTAPLSKKIEVEDLIQKHKDEERKLQAAQKAINEGVDEGKIKEIIKEEYFKGKEKFIDVNAFYNNLNVNVDSLKAKIRAAEIAKIEDEKMPNAVQEKLKAALEGEYGKNIESKMQEAVSAEEERIKKEEEAKQRQEKKLLAAQKIINETITPESVKEIIKQVFTDLGIYHISVDEIYKEGDDENLRKQIIANEIINFSPEQQSSAIEKKLREEVRRKYEEIVKNKVDGTKQAAWDFINKSVTAEKVKEIIKNILLGNEIVKEEKAVDGFIKLADMSEVYKEENLNKLRESIKADEIAQFEKSEWNKTVDEKLREAINDEAIGKIKKVRNKLEKILKNTDKIDKQIIAKKYLQKFKNIANKLKKKEGVSRIGANFRGYLARKKLGKLKKRKELLKKIVENKDVKDKQLAVKNSFLKLENVNEKLKSGEKAIKDGVTEKNIKEIIQKEYIKENKAITADAIYKSLNVNIDALKEKIKVEEIAKLKVEQTPNTVREQLKKVVKNEYGEKIEGEIQKAENKKKKKIKKK